MENKKSKSYLGECEWQGNRYSCIIAIFLLLPSISVASALAQAADSSSKWDQPFGKPMYLLHTNGGKHYDSNGEEFGTIIDERWILDPNNSEFIDIQNPNSQGAIQRYSIDQALGPYYTPREVCTVAAGKYPCIAQGSDFVLFSCQGMPAQPETPDNPQEGPCANACDRSQHLVWDGYEGCSCICEEGWKFDENGDCKLDTSEADEELVGGIKEIEGEILVVTSQGTVGLEPGENGRIELSPGEKAEIKVKCKDLADVFNIITVFGGDRNPVSGYIACLLLTACKRELGEPISLDKTAEFGDVPSSYAADLPTKLEFGLQRGSLSMEIVHDRIALEVKTPTVTVSSEGKNTFGVSYDPNSGSSLLSAYKNPIHIQPGSSNLAPFTLDAGQQAEVSSEMIGPITPLDQISDGMAGPIHVGPDGQDVYGPAGGADNAAGQTGLTSEVPQGGCYADPMTGEIICVDAFGEVTNPSRSMGTVNTMLPDTGSSVPQSLQECEAYTSEICGTWTRMDDHFNAQWDNGASAVLYVERWDKGAVVFTRQDTKGSSAGLTARYEGRCMGNHAEGTVTWTWNGSKWSGTWSASW